MHAGASAHRKPNTRKVGASMLLYASMLALAAASMPSEDISINGPEGDLGGTWIKAADASAPVVLIIPGSGPTDRDGNSPLGINASTYRCLLYTSPSPRD